MHGSIAEAAEQLENNNLICHSQMAVEMNDTCTSFNGTLGDNGWLDNGQYFENVSIISCSDYDKN